MSIFYLGVSHMVKTALMRQNSLSNKKFGFYLFNYLFSVLRQSLK